MKIREIIRLFDERRKNKMEADDKAKMLYSLEKRINLSVLVPCGKGASMEANPAPDEIQEKECIVSDGFEEVYFSFLGAQCALYEGNLPRYNTDIEEYMRLLREYAYHISRTNSAQGHRMKV